MVRQLIDNIFSFLLPGLNIYDLWQHKQKLIYLFTRYFKLFDNFYRCFSNLEDVTLLEKL